MKVLAICGVSFRSIVVGDKYSIRGSVSSNKMGAWKAAFGCYGSEDIKDPDPVLQCYAYSRVLSKGAWLRSKQALACYKKVMWKNDIDNNMGNLMSWSGFRKVHEDELEGCVWTQNALHYRRGDCIREFKDKQKGYGPFIDLTTPRYKNIYNEPLGLVRYHKSQLERANEDIAKLRHRHRCPLFCGDDNGTYVTPSKLMGREGNYFWFKLLHRTTSSRSSALMSTM